MFGYLYYYTIVGKGEVVLAIPSALFGNISYELDALYAQGFVYFSEIQAINPLRAVEIFTENENREISKLRSEIRRLHTAYDEIQRENDTLRRNSFHSNSSRGSVENYEIFGFSQPPQPSELKKRYRSLCQKLHPDKEGDKQLFQLIQKAYDDLTR
ncbi:J domain-containing protein [Pseudomonas sp. UMAB-40]|uniref:J domain-containing protein n=1 Tax=Pseudomonas sp. UMAB-40 TaxID=1365407 RepID=UPI001C57CE97|nr:J domain-containing protein [Pseudomonas sp. UMAB-40]